MIHYDSLCFTPVKHGDCLVVVPCQTRFARPTGASEASLTGTATKQSLCLSGANLYMCIYILYNYMYSYNYISIYNYSYRYIYIYINSYIYIYIYMCIYRYHRGNQPGHPRGEGVRLPAPAGAGRRLPFEERAFLNEERAFIKIH